MRIQIVCPAPRGARSGNRVTAERWRYMLRELGNEVHVVRVIGPGRADLLIALHATHSRAAIARFHARSPGAPIVVGLAGTDLYVDLPRHPRSWRALEHVTRFVALHPLAAAGMPSRLRPRVRVIVQSARA